MKKLKLFAFYLLIVFVSWGVYQNRVIGRAENVSDVNPAYTTKSQVRLSKAYGKLPMHFEANQGQTAGEVAFLSRGPGYSLFLTKNEAVLSLRKPEISNREPKLKVPVQKTISENPESETFTPLDNTVSNGASTKSTTLRMQLVGANPKPEVKGVVELPGKSNYFLGNDPNRWRTQVSNYARVRYEEVYPGINLEYYGKEGHLEFDFVVKSGEDPRVIKINVTGANHLNLDKNGNLSISLNEEDSITLLKPTIYQNINNKRQTIKGDFRIEGNEIGFDIDTYDPSIDLVVDPELLYSTYLGGSEVDIGKGIDVDAAGNIYVAGTTTSSDFPTEIPLDEYSTDGNFNNEEVFITKISADGTNILYSTYLGGVKDDFGNGLAVDSQGNATVVGQTESEDFPISTAFQDKKNVSSDAFVAKISTSGDRLIFSTYLGGDSGDGANGVDVDAEDNIYITGSTRSREEFFGGILFSDGFPVLNAFQDALAGNTTLIGDAFVTKMSPAGALVYSTYFGGTQRDEGQDIAVDAEGNAFFTGFTSKARQTSEGEPENDFHTIGAFQPTFAGVMDAFIAKLSSAGGLVFSSYLGGSGTDNGLGIGVDPNGNGYVTGRTNSTDFFLSNAYQNQLGGATDVFLTKVNSGGSPLYSTYIGGSDDDHGFDVVAGGNENAFLFGGSRSSQYPQKDSLQPARHGGILFDAVITRFNADGSEIIFSTFFGGFGDENRNFGAIAIDPGGNNLFITGKTGSDDNRNFPSTPSAVQPIFGGAADAFIAKIEVSQTKPLIYDQVATGGPPVFSLEAATPQQILPQFLLSSSDDKLLFKFEGKSTDGKVGLCVLNTRVTSAAFPPITLKVKIIDPGGTEIVPFSILSIRSGDVGKQFDVTQDGTYEVEVSADPSSPGPFPAPFQIHLAADVGLPRKLINGVPEVPRAIRQDILVNHTAPRPQGLFGQDSTTAQTALFKFVKRSEVSQFANAVIVPPSSSSTGFPLAQGIVRAPDPMNPLDITTPTARTPVCEGGDPTGMVVDFTQIPDPAIPGVTTASLAGTVCAVIGENDATSVTLPLANGVTGLVLDMGSGQEIVNGDGVDFQVFSPAGNYTVAVSNTPYAGTFIQIGDTVSGTQSFDLAGMNLTSARFVLVTAASQVTLDAVKALNVFIDEEVVDPTNGSSIPVERLNFATITMRRAKASETAIDPVLELIAPDGTLFGPINDSGFGDKTSLNLSDAALIHKDLAQTGFYRFLARGYDQTPTDQSFGAFFVRLESGGEYDADDILVSETDEVNTVVQKTGSISGPRERDSYIFQWHPGQSIKVVVNTTSGDLDPVVELHDPEGFLIAANDNFTDRGRNAVLDLILPANTFNAEAVSPELPDPSTYRLVVGAVDPMRGLNDKSELDMGTAYFRGTANGDYEVKVFTGDLAGGTPATDPVPDIKANGSDGPVTPTGNLSITVALDPGSRSGDDADWWIAADTPFGWFDFDLVLGWLFAGDSPFDIFATYQGPLFDLTPPFELNMPGLPSGTYTFYFAIDMNMNDELDFIELFFDSVTVTVP